MVREGIEDVAGRRRQAGDEFRGESRHAPIGEETVDAPDGLILEIGNALAPLRVGFMRVADGAQHFHDADAGEGPQPLSGAIAENLRWRQPIDFTRRTHECYFSRTACGKNNRSEEHTSELQTLMRNS